MPGRWPPVMAVMAVMAGDPYEGAGVPPSFIRAWSGKRSEEIGSVH